MPEIRAHDPDGLQREIAERRQDLVSSMAELEGLVRRTLDVKGQLRNAASRLARDVQRRPLPYVAGAGALFVLMVGRLALQRRQAAKRPRRFVDVVF